MESQPKNPEFRINALHLMTLNVCIKNWGQLGKMIIRS